MLKEVKALSLMCHFVIVYGLFRHRAFEADWFNLQIVMSHSLEELKAPQLQMFQQNVFFFYHYMGLHRGGRCLVLFFWKQSWGGLIFPQFSGKICWLLGLLFSFLWSTLRFRGLKPACSCGLPLIRLPPMYMLLPRKTEAHALPFGWVCLSRIGLNPKSLGSFQTSPTGCIAPLF